MYLSKSDFKVARTCATTKLYYKKLGYPSTRDDDPYLQFLADGGYMVEAIAKLCHPDGIEIGFDGGPELSGEQTIVAIKANEVVTFFEATLIFQGRLARVDILTKRGDTFELKADIATLCCLPTGQEMVKSWQDVARAHASRERS